MNIEVNSPDEAKLREALVKRTDAEARRIERFLAMPDLSRTPGSPIAELAQRIVTMPDFKNFDLITVPEIASVGISFDLFDFAADHPARSKSDTYYVNEKNILRTHTTVMWYYYLQQVEIKARIARGESVGSLSFGKVYRKDEIDRRHMNIFHQMDGWFLCRRDEKVIGPEDLQQVLVKIAQAIFGPEVKYRFNPDTFPYTDPSLEMEIDLGQGWVEVLGSGVVRGSVLERLGVDSKQYNGWAFGFGLERLAILSLELPDIRLLWSQDERVKKQLKLGQKFKEVSKYPAIVRDISFVVPNTFVPNNYFDLIRDIVGDMIEEVTLLDKYENADKFGAGKLSFTYRIIYRSIERTLTAEEIEPLQQKIEVETKRQFAAEIR
ncbi:MAG: hypothetical protein HYT48_02005 [Candidatus Vogelbacteria bacterium]|nr:hypothetical protein [Candidatus Vogelbacteria bacterium]